MSSEDKFREKLRDLVESKEFTFDESNWERAKLLFESESRRGNTGLWIASLFLFMISGMAWFALHAEMAQNKQLAERSPVIERMAAAPARSPQTATSEAASGPIVIPAAPRQASRVYHNENRPASRAVNPVAARSPEPPISVSSPVTQAPAIVEESSPRGTPVAETPVAETPLTATLTRTEAGEQEKKTTVTETENKATPALEIKPAEEAVASVPPTPSVAPLEAPKPDTVKTIVYLPAPERNIPMLSLEGGISFNPGWKNGGETDARSFTPVFALHYHNQVADKLQMTLGVQFQQISKLSYSSFTSKVTRLGLGEESRVTVITPARMQFIGVPLKFHYRPDSLQSFGIGYHLNYLLNVDANVVKYTDRNGTEEDREAYTSGGYVEGFRTFSSQASVFYCRRVHRLFSVNAELLLGLGDLKEDGFFGIAQKERHHAFRISLIYDLQRK